MRQLLNVEYTAEHESASIEGEAELQKWRIALESTPPEARARGRRGTTSFVTPELDALMGGG